MGMDAMNLVHRTTSEAALATITHCLQHGQRVDGTMELLNYGFVVAEPSSDPIVTADEDQNARIARYTRAEFKLFQRGERCAAEYAKHAKLWTGIQNPDGTVNSCYGYLVFIRPSAGRSRFAKHPPITQWQWAELSLKGNRHTRQAVIKLSLPDHQWFGNRDQVCCQHLAFHIRGQALHLTCVMRSNDATRGLLYDMPWFCSLIPRMKNCLRSHYPELKVGTYTHFVHSMHVYDSEAEKARRMIGWTESSE